MLTSKITVKATIRDVHGSEFIKQRYSSLDQPQYSRSMDAGTSMDIGLTPSEEQILSEKNYEFFKMIGEGACGKVYLCNYKRKQNEKIPMACKIIHTSTAPKEIVSKFLPRELDILQKVKHPNIVQVLCIFQSGNGDKFLIFMRIAEVGDLLDFILREGEISESVMKVWVFEIAVALEYLHTLEICHRDLKCENILITERYNIKLADFGFSRFVVDPIGKQVKSTTYCGSLPYCAPEILRGKPYYPKPADIWAMGVVLFVGLNKSMPFPDLPVRRIVRLQAKKAFKYRPRIYPTLSAECINVIQMLLEPDYKKRVTITSFLKSKWFEINGEPMKHSEAEMSALEEANRMKRGFWANLVNTDPGEKSSPEVTHVKSLIDTTMIPSIAVSVTKFDKQAGRVVKHQVEKTAKSRASEPIDPNELHTDVKEFDALVQVVDSKTAVPSTELLGQEKDADEIWFYALEE